MSHLALQGHQGIGHTVHTNPAWAASVSDLRPVRTFLEPHLLSTPLFQTFCGSDSPRDPVSASVTVSSTRSTAATERGGWGATGPRLDGPGGLGAWRGAAGTECSGYKHLLSAEGQAQETVSTQGT